MTETLSKTSICIALGPRTAAFGLWLFVLVALVISPLRPNMAMISFYPERSIYRPPCKCSSTPAMWSAGPRRAS